MQADDTKLILTVPVLEDGHTRGPIYVPSYGVPMANSSSGLFFGLNGSDCKRPCIAAAFKVAAAQGRQVSMVDVAVARPHDLHHPTNLRARRLIHGRYLHAADRAELGRLWMQAAGNCAGADRQAFSTKARQVDWSDFHSFPVAFPTVLNALFEALPALEILVIPAVTSFSIDPAWTAVMPRAKLSALVRSVTTLTSRDIVIQGRMPGDDSFFDGVRLSA